MKACTAPRVDTCGWAGSETARRTSSEQYWGGRSSVDRHDVKGTRPLWKGRRGGRVGSADSRAVAAVMVAFGLNAE